MPPLWSSSGTIFKTEAWKSKLLCNLYQLTFKNVLSNHRKNIIRDHPFKTSANFHDFWPLPPCPTTISVRAKCLWRGFLILMYFDLWTIGTWGHPSPPRHAEVLNEWSNSLNFVYHFFFVAYTYRLIIFRNSLLFNIL